MSLEELKEKVEEVCNLNEKNCSPDEKHKKYIDDQVQNILKFSDSIKDTLKPCEKGEFHYLKGKLLNINNGSEAEKELGKATKFNNAKAWNEMGELKFKQGDFSMAKLCFDKAIDIEKNTLYYRNLSILMRRLPHCSIKERDENIEKSHSYIKEALKLDIKDGQSWIILGNSYLTAYFTVEASQENLKSAKSSYLKALEDPKAAVLPELHYGKFQIEWYEEDYEKALNSLKKTTELDPTWSLIQNKYEECYKFLSALSNATHTKGHLKSLSQRKQRALLNDIKTSHLGPYEKGSSDLTSGSKPNLVRLSLLADGLNSNKIVLGKVVFTLIPESGLPFAFCIVDSDGTCRAVTVYNWDKKHSLRIGDSVAILAPVLKKHSVLDIKEFYSIRVAVPLMLTVNGRPIQKNEVATSVVVSQKKE